MPEHLSGRAFCLCQPLHVLLTEAQRGGSCLQGTAQGHHLYWHCSGASSILTCPQHTLALLTEHSVVMPCSATDVYCLQYTAPCTAGSAQVWGAICSGPALRTFAVISHPVLVVEAVCIVAHLVGVVAAQLALLQAAAGEPARQ